MFYLEKTVEGDFDKIGAKFKEVILSQKFKLLGQIRLDEKFKKALSIDHPKYEIVEFCSARHAYDLVKSDPMVGIFLPCRAIVREVGDGKVHIAVINPPMICAFVTLDETAAKAIETVTEVIKTMLKLM